MKCFSLFNDFFEPLCILGHPCLLLNALLLLIGQIVVLLASLGVRGRSRGKLDKVHV
jgi:hypothetical protein